jgi:hypothetical protein
VEIVDVDDGEPEILSAALDLIVKVAWRETVAAGNDVSRLHHTRPVVLAVEKASIAFLGSGWSSVERDVTAFRANDDFFPPDATVRDADADSLPNSAFRPLASVVDCGVE